MLSNYKGVAISTVDKDIFEVPIGWWDKDMKDSATVSFVESSNAIIGGNCDVSKSEFLRGLLYNVVSLYKYNEVTIALIGLDSEFYEDFNVLGNVSITHSDSDIDMLLKELVLDIEKRLHLLDTHRKTFKEYNSSSPIKLPYRLVVLPDVSKLAKSITLKKVGNELIMGESRERGTITDRVYVLDCLNNADSAGVYFLSMVDDSSYTYLKSSKMLYVGLYNLVKGMKIGFNWDLVGLNTSYSMVGKGVLENPKEESYNFYSSTITRIDLINKLNGLK